MACSHSAADAQMTRHFHAAIKKRVWRTLVYSSSRPGSGWRPSIVDCQDLDASQDAHAHYRNSMGHSPESKHSEDSCSAINSKAPVDDATSACAARGLGSPKEIICAGK